MLLYLDVKDIILYYSTSVLSLNRKVISLGIRDRAQDPFFLISNSRF